MRRYRVLFNGLEVYTVCTYQEIGRRELIKRARETLDSWCRAFNACPIKGRYTIEAC